MKKFDVTFQPRAGGKTTLRMEVKAITGTEARETIELQFPAANVMVVEEVLPFRAPSVQMPLFSQPETLPFWGTQGT